MTTLFRAFLDESSTTRGPQRQEYLIGAAVLAGGACEAAREQLRSLLLPGQIKIHWTTESERRRREIVSRIVDLGSMKIVVSHLDARRHRTERYRRKTLSTLYSELVAIDVFELTLEGRSTAQDSSDRAHLVALQGQGFDRRLRIDHRRGGDEPLLWIADAVLGAINAAHLGETGHLDALRSTLVLRTRTPESLDPEEEADESGQGERP